LVCAFLIAVIVALSGCGSVQTATTPNPAAAGATVLPPPALTSDRSLEEVLALRRSIRSFRATTLTTGELGQLLWAAQGITDEGGFRTAPSAGALYPLEVYVALAEGVFHYEPDGHRLVPVDQDDVRSGLQQAALGQQAVGQAPAVFVVTAVYQRTAQKYGPERATRYVQLEAGHAAQNLLLEAVALGLGAVPIGAFDDTKVQQVLSLPGDHEPLYLIPVGHPTAEGK
jgi:SagB-type dehydrogenase family enzyme